MKTHAQTGLRSFATLLVLVATACTLATPTLGLTSSPPASETPVQPTLTPLPPSETSTQSPTLTPTGTPPPSATPAASAIPHLAGGAPLSLDWILMLDEHQGWGAGYSGGAPNEHLAFTSDGGQSWSDVTPPQPAAPPESGGMNLVADALDVGHAWAIFSPHQPIQPAGSQVVWATTDGGKTWMAGQSLPMQGSEEVFQPSQLVFSSASDGWLLAHVGAGMSHDYVDLFHTSDGGRTWRLVVNPEADNLPMSCHKNGLAFLDAQQGWAAGDCQGVEPGIYLYRTGDGGATWNAVNLPAPAPVPDLFTSEDNLCGAHSPAFTDRQNGSLLVTCNLYDPSKAQDWLFVTSNGGTSWQPQKLPGGGGAVQFTDAKLGWYLGNDRFYRTQDGGNTWEERSRVTWSGQPEFVSATLGWVVARSGGATALVTSTDGGLHWQEIHPIIAK